MDPGFPPANRARWFFNGREIKGHPVTTSSPYSTSSSTSGSHLYHHSSSNSGLRRRRHELGATFKFREASVQAAGNYSCIPFNSVGTALKVDKEIEFAVATENEAVASLGVEVHTAPTLIKGLEKLTGTSVNLLPT